MRVYRLALVRIRESSTGAIGYETITDYFEPARRGPAIGIAVMLKPASANDRF